MAHILLGQGIRDAVCGARLRAGTFNNPRAVIARSGLRDEAISRHSYRESGTQRQWICFSVVRQESGQKDWILPTLLHTCHTQIIGSMKGTALAPLIGDSVLAQSVKVCA